jgi:hypothetical protein
MTSKTLKHAIWLVMAMSATALAAGGPPSGGGGGGGSGGGKPTTEATNNLSVPAIMLGSKGEFAIACETTGFTDLVPPDKGPVYYPESCAASQDGGQVCVAAGNYYVQRDAKWQAPCFVATGTGIAVRGAWGDNLAGDAKLKVGSPIRVELVLWDAADVALGQQGYEVIKLEPSELDRLSDYGHLAGGAVDAWYPVAKDLGAIVFDPGATLRIEQVVDGQPVSPAVFNGAAGGEINATGKIVYGYNLRVTAAGTYRITYTIPRGTFSECDAGTCEGNTAILDIDVISGGGGGGGKGGGKPPGAGEGE